MKNPLNEYAFRNGHIDAPRRQLFVGGRAVQVEPKVFDFIAYLIVNRERAVGRDELIAAVWGVTEVSIGVLDQAVRKARKALGDSGNSQSSIRTIVRFGYRWVAAEDCDALAIAAPTAARNETPECADEDPMPVFSPARVARHASRIRVALAIAAVLALIASGGFVAWRKTNLAHTSTDIIAIAVLPVVDGSVGADHAWVRLGVMALIQNALRERSNMRLVADADVLGVSAAIPAAFGDTTAKVVERLQQTSGAQFAVASSVSLVDATWTLRYKLWRGTIPIDHGEISKGDVGELARELSHRVALALGAKPATFDVAQADTSDERYAKASSAVLTGDFRDARLQLLDGLNEQPRDLRAEVLLADVERRLGDAQSAQERLQRVLGDGNAEGNPNIIGDALNVLARVDAQRRDIASAESDYSRLLDYAERHNNATWRSAALTGLGFVAARRLNYRAAESFYAGARAIRETVGDRLNLARQDANEAILELNRGRAQHALEQLRSAHAVFEQAGMRQEQAMALFDMAEANAQLGKLAEQRAMNSAALSIYQVLGDEYGEARTHARLAEGWLLAGEWSKGLTDANAAREMAARLGYPTVEAESLLYIGRIRQGQGALAEGEAALRRAITGFSQAPDQDGVDESTRELAVVIAQRGRIDEALSLLDTLRQKEIVGHLPSAADALSRGRVLAIARRGADASKELLNSLTLASESGNLALRNQSAIALANVLLDGHEVDAAEMPVQIASAWQEERFDAKLLAARYFASRGDEHRAHTAWTLAKAAAGERAVPNLAALQ